MDGVDFLEGFLKTFLGDSDLPEIDTCYASMEPLTQYTTALINDIETVDIFDAIKQIELFIFDLQVDLMPCMEMQDDINAITQWA